jgi:hypothetical protein
VGGSPRTANLRSSATEPYTRAAAARPGSGRAERCRRRTRSPRNKVRVMISRPAPLQNDLKTSSATHHEGGRRVLVERHEAA